jgi:hypothetical protein
VNSLVDLAVSSFTRNALELKVFIYGVVVFVYFDKVFVVEVNLGAAE